MKQILLLIAVYSLIINQSSKSSEIKKESLPPIKGKQQHSPNTLKTESGQPSTGDLMAPVFGFTTYRLLTGDPLFTETAFKD